MKKLEDYLALPYTTILRRDEDGDIVARVDELAGCAAHGRTAEEVLENLEEVKRLWIIDCLERGDQVPEPADAEALPSGKWVQRVPRTLHGKLVQLAAREKVSLNQLVTSILAEAVGTRKVLQSAEATESMTERVKSALSKWEMGPVSNQLARWESQIAATTGLVQIYYHMQKKRSPSDVTSKEWIHGSSVFGKRLPDQVKIRKPRYGKEEKNEVHQH